MLDIQPGEIVYCNLTVATIPKGKRKAVVHELRKVVFAIPYAPAWDNMIRISDRGDTDMLNRAGLKEDVMVTGVEILVRCGMKQKY